MNRIQRNPSWIIFISLILIIACRLPDKGFSAVYLSSCTETEEKIDNTSTKKIISDPDQFDKHIVEIEGVYRWGPEQSVIFPNSLEKNLGRGLWIEFTDSLKEENSGKYLLENFEEFSKIFGKRIIVRGAYNKENSGHLNQYPGAIEDVCYIEVLE